MYVSVDIWRDGCVCVLWRRNVIIYACSCVWGESGKVCVWGGFARCPSLSRDESTCNRFRIMLRARSRMTVSGSVRSLSLSSGSISHFMMIYLEGESTSMGGEVVCVFICVRSRWAAASSAIAWWSVLKQRDAHRREGLFLCTYIQTQALVCTLSMSSCSTSHFMICFERDGRTCVGGSCACV